MALADLVAELERDSAEREAAVLAAADAEAARLESDCAARLAARRQTLLSAEESRLGQEAARATRVLERETSSALLAARRRTLGRIFAAVDDRLGEPEWIARSSVAIEERLEAAFALAGEGELSVIVEPALADRVRDGLAGRAGARVEAVARTGAGFLVRARNGAVEIDDRWRSRFARARSALEIELAPALEEESA